MSKLLQILTSSKDKIAQENAEIEVAQQNVNLQALKINITRQRASLEKQRNDILRAGGDTMWQKMVGIDKQLDDLAATEVRATGYAREFLS